MRPGYADPRQPPIALQSRLTLSVIATPAAVHRLAQLSGGLPVALRIIGEHIASRPGTPIGDLADELRPGDLVDAFSRCPIG
ncbi:hypothetical protein ACN27G_16800 [Plantactinospora sp. WMMB334]|uniref:hypothetical protein n=1 Tax=Plantactinospora sp. WMMB334 TaxID=3404119 RepID=UPI003B93886D